MIFLFSFLNSQFISELPVSTNSSNNTWDQQEYIKSTSPLNRFIFSHGFSTSMVSNGKTFYSVSGINNNFSYNLFTNLSLNGNVGLYMVNSPFQNNNQFYNQMLMTYDASVTYRPSKNSILQFRFLNTPQQRDYSSFYKRFNQ